MRSNLGCREMKSDRSKEDESEFVKRGERFIEQNLDLLKEIGRL